MSGPKPGERAPGRAGPPPEHRLLGHLRAGLVFLGLLLLVAGGAYPALVTGIAQAIDPGSANGSLLYYPNGTVAGSAAVAQNLSAGTLGPYLFWGRPSLTDYNTTLGAATPPGPSDPALRALLNETIAYMRLYGNFTVNATLPYWWVAPSASSIDPDLVPEAVLVQIPRIAEHNLNGSLANLTYSERVTALQDFVNARIVAPVVPFLGVPYVNVLELDLALLPYVGK